MSWNYRTPKCHICYRPAYYQGDDGFHYCASHYSLARLKDEIAELYQSYSKAGRLAEYDAILEALPDDRSFFLNFRDALKTNWEKPERECTCMDLPDGRGDICDECRERAHNSSIPE